MLKKRPGPLLGSTEAGKANWKKRRMTEEKNSCVHVYFSIPADPLANSPQTNRLKRLIKHGDEKADDLVESWCPSKSCWLPFGINTCMYKLLKTVPWQTESTVQFLNNIQEGSGAFFSFLFCFCCSEDTANF